MFKKVLVKNKTVSLSRIPPCQSVLRLHLQWSAYIAYLPRKSEEKQIDLPTIDQFGWFSDGNIVWTEEEIFPGAIAKYIEAEDEETYEVEDEFEDMYEVEEDDDPCFGLFESDDDDEI